MIKVTRLNNQEFYINCHQIEFIESTPDTVISLISGRKVIVKEPPEVIIERIIDYRRKIGLHYIED